MPTDPVTDLRKAAENSLYVSVGLGLLAFQAVQVRRRQLERDLGLPVPPRPADLSRVLGRVTGRA